MIFESNNECNIDQGNEQHDKAFKLSEIAIKFIIFIFSLNFIHYTHIQTIDNLRVCEKQLHTTKLESEIHIQKQARSAIMVHISNIKYPIHYQLQMMFPNQTKGFYSHVISSYVHSITGNKDPSIIMLVSDKKNSKTVNCVAKKLLSLLTNDYDSEFDYKLAILNSDKYKNKDSQLVKEELDGYLVNIFSKLNGKIALIENIQNIPAKSMILFYTYGDDMTTAKYRGIMVLFTYELNEETFSNNIEKYEELTKNYSKLQQYLILKIFNEIKLRGALTG